jgi:predicted ATPase
MANESNPTKIDFSFRVIQIKDLNKDHGAYLGLLVIDNWDDWGEYSTMFNLWVIDPNGNRLNVGLTKIGQFGMAKEQRSAIVPEKFTELDESFFSIGQDVSFYKNMRKLDFILRENILRGLKDIVRDEDLWLRAQQERVTKKSLLRSVTPESVKGQFRRTLEGGAILFQYKFTYKPPFTGGDESISPSLAFEVKPDSTPPTNIHVLIGRNGVGKTYLLNNIVETLTGESNKTTGAFIWDIKDGERREFANLISISFSAFDPFRSVPEKKKRSNGLEYSYIGLRHPYYNGKGSISKTERMFLSEFKESLPLCMKGDRLEWWRRAMVTLEEDPLFKEYNLMQLAEIRETSQLKRKASGLFKTLSSGHKIVLLTMTRLIEKVEERTLVLIDEPESHLHPPLLSAFIRALSSLLANRNGVSILATHSPVVLQEVPRSCVWKLHRTSKEKAVRVVRPNIETFGENVGVLTNEVFRLGETKSGFYRMIEDAVGQESSYEAILHRFGNQLGAEARAEARGLMSVVKKKD